ncbi:hypothetical protein NAPIS_ORF00013 [Vairimorpha apis BRL 01]|uniref:Uncharacterized protein n=1 Tax=Vairimorpha apis BRL 01 TaxID=1037528 RepID=T0MN43_9MICR|nr:hypothetical protein NAPIS_ORF00013 [Vairimorpha apis BRL 01]
MLKNFERKVDTTIKTDKELLIVKIGVTSLDNLQQVESEKFRKYDELANELGLIHGCKTNIIPYVITWDGIVNKHHSKHRKELGITDRIEAYIQSTTFKKTLESISMEYRRGERIAETEEADQQTTVFQGQILAFSKRLYEGNNKKLNLIIKYITNKAKIIPYLMTWEAYRKEINSNNCTHLYSLTMEAAKKVFKKINKDLYPEDLTSNNECEIKESHIISSVLNMRLVE